jgi:murein DD-endopeptidase MepM/ murein hydrolase activator NlpD
MGGDSGRGAVETEVLAPPVQMAEVAPDPMAEPPEPADPVVEEIAAADPEPVAVAAAPPPLPGHRPELPAAAPSVPAAEEAPVATVTGPKAPPLPPDPLELPEPIPASVEAQVADAPMPPVPPATPEVSEAEPPAAAVEEPETEVVASAPEVLPATPPRSGQGFQWPLVGTIVSGFGSKDGGLHNDGLNIAAAAGSPVLAADDGVVAYAGNELRGYGNLVLVRHEDGWVTAYGHNDQMLVSRGDRVRAGQEIATVGATGAVASPQLHFEIRRGAQAIDPLSQLPPMPQS